MVGKWRGKQDYEMEGCEREVAERIKGGRKKKKQEEYGAKKEGRKREER